MLEIIGYKENVKPCYYEIVTIPGFGRFLTSHIPHHKIDKKTCLLNPVLPPDTDFLNINIAGNIHIFSTQNNQSMFFPKETEGFEYSYYLNPIIRTQFILRERGYILFPFITLSRHHKSKQPGKQ